jgi:membrane protease YdiL (CAAX protease family)
MRIIMNKLTHWIKRHQVLAFFLMAYAISWPGFLLVYFIFPGNQVVEGLSAPWVVFSPALTAMLTSGIVEPQPKYAHSHSHWIAFFLSWLFASVIFSLYSWKVQKMDSGVAIILISSIFALFPAWVLSSAYARTPGIRKQFATLLKPRGSVLWYGAIFLIFPGIPLLSLWITRLLGGEARFYLADLGFEGAAIALLLEFLRGFLMTGGINEESGWRGFALPRLQARHSVIAASLIVGIFWALWYLPYDLAPINRAPSLAWFLEYRLFWRVLFGVILAWLYNRTNGSLLAPALFHPAMNAFGNQFSPTTISTVLFIALALYAIVSDRMWKKLPSDHPAVYQSPVTPKPGEEIILIAPKLSQE